MLVAHNARFDVGFLQRALGAIDGRRLELPVLDTVSLARRLLAGRGRALRPRHARRSVLASDAAVPPCASRRTGHRRAAAAADRDRAGARCAHRRGRARPRGVGAAARAGPQAPRRAGAGRARRVHPARRARAGDVRRQGRRSPRSRALVLRLAAAEAGAGGGARSARSRRLRAARQRARGGAGRARADPCLAPAGECPQHPSRARALPAARRRRSRADARAARRSEERWRAVCRPVGVSPHGGDRTRGPARRVRAAHLPPEGAGGGGHVPARPAGTLRGAVSRQRREPGLRGGHRAARTLPRGPRRGRARRGACAAREARGRAEVRGGVAPGRRPRRARPARRLAGGAPALAGPQRAPAGVRHRSRAGPLSRGARRACARLAEPAAAWGSLVRDRERAARARPPACRSRRRAGRSVASRRRGRGGRAPGGRVRRPGAGCRPDRDHGSDGRARGAAADRRWARRASPSARRCGARTGATGARCTRSSRRPACSSQ